MTPDPLGRIGPEAGVGDRLTVRYRLPDGGATDVVGWVAELDDDRVRIEPPAADGRPDAVTVDRRRIILARRVPPALGGLSLDRTTAAELQRIALPGWLADAEPLDAGHPAWTLRFGNGFTGRANSCLAVGDPGLPYAEAADLVTERYLAAGLPPRVQVITGSAEDEGLTGLGWRPCYVATTVMAHRLAELLPAHPDARVGPVGPAADQPATEPVSISAQLTEDWWRAYLQYRPIPDHDTARRILTNHPPVGLAAIRSGDRVVALGRGQLTDDWLGIAGLWTDPGHRRRGLATEIILELARWAARRSARYAYLQVAQENAGAIAAYSRLGFVRHHDYHYLEPPAEPERGS